jgi:hypothetical protein
MPSNYSTFKYIFVLIGTAVIRAKDSQIFAKVGDTRNGWFICGSSFHDEDTDWDHDYLL